MSFAAFTKRMASDQGRIFWKPEHYQTLAKHYGVSEEQVAKAVAPAPIITPFPELRTKAAAADVQRSFKWTMNDGEIDRAGDIVMADGVDVATFRRNPIALLQHSPDRPIGTWTNVHAEGGKLRGTLNLAPTRLGEYVRENIAAGVLKAASIGFLVQEFEPIKNGGFKFNKIELIETSVVSIPASRGSLRERETTFEERQAEREATRDSILASQRHHDDAEKKRRDREARAAETRKQRLLDEALARKRAKQSPEERARERWAAAAKVLGKDEVEIMMQRARDRGRA